MTSDNLEKLKSDLSDIQTEWDILAEKLRVPHSRIQMIDGDERSTEHKRRAAIQAWFDGSEEACVGTVVKALKEMGKKRLASEIAKKWK